MLSKGLRKGENFENKNLVFIFSLFSPKKRSDQNLQTSCSLSNSLILKYYKMNHDVMAKSFILKKNSSKFARFGTDPTGSVYMYTPNLEEFYLLFFWLQKLVCSMTHNS